MKEYQFEVCANSVESCLAAQTGGANRVELCAGIPEGGTTPSYGEIAMARKVLDTARLHVIIRPRGGDFLYSPLETKIMLEDIEITRHLGVDGVVFGCLTANGDIDTVAMKELMEASHGLSVTFHRAFDVCRNPDEALEQIIELGCERILTSGQQPTAEQGIPLLKKLHRQAAGRITLLAGCGVNEKNISRIAGETGIQVGNNKYGQIILMFQFHILCNLFVNALCIYAIRNSRGQFRKFRRKKLPALSLIRK